MNFPCVFILKIMGAAESHLDVTLVPILAKHITDMSAVEMTTRMSKNGKFSALTVKFEAQSQEQLDGIYRELSSREDVLMVL